MSIKDTAIDVVKIRQFSDETKYTFFLFIHLFIATVLTSKPTFVMIHAFYVLRFFTFFLYH